MKSPHDRRVGRLACVAAAVLALAPHPAAAQARDEAAFVRALLHDLQPLSIAKGREHCGLIGRDAGGALVATPPVMGGRAACSSPWPDGMDVVASYHTHGGFTPGHVGELPSQSDVLSDNALGIDGWVATPGGRLWFVHGGRMAVKLACGPGCLPVAPDFGKSRPGGIDRSYAWDALVRRLAK